jgi:hypothetical protein
MLNQPSEILLIAFLIVVWWVGVWGLLETLLHQYIKGSFTKAICVYTLLIVLVISIVWSRPHLLENFI